MVVPWYDCLAEGDLDQTFPAFYPFLSGPRPNGLIGTAKGASLVDQRGCKLLVLLEDSFCSERLAAPKTGAFGEKAAVLTQQMGI